MNTPQSEKPILFIQTAFLGDLLLMIPLLRRARQLRPKSKFILVARSGYGRLIQELRLVDQVYEVEKNKTKSYAEVFSQLSHFSYEWVICPHESLTSARWSFVVQAEKKIGFHQIWNFFVFNQRIKKNRLHPEALRQMSLLLKLDSSLQKDFDEIQGEDLKNADHLGRMRDVPDWATMSLRSDLLKLSPALNVHERSLAIFPGSVWPTKQWTFEGFLELGKILSQHGYEILWMGSGQERELCTKLQEQVQNSKNLAGQYSLLQSLVILSRVRAVISNDSAGGHLAAVAGTPTVGIFGPTILDQGFRPWNSHARIAELFDVTCRPCGRHGHKKCPIGTHECMKKLSPHLILQRLGTLL